MVETTWANRMLDNLESARCISVVEADMGIPMAIYGGLQYIMIHKIYMMIGYFLSLCLRHSTAVFVCSCAKQPMGMLAHRGHPGWTTWLCFTSEQWSGLSADLGQNGRYHPDITQVPLNQCIFLVTLCHVVVMRIDVMLFVRFCK